MSETAEPASPNPPPAAPPEPAVTGPEQKPGERNGPKGPEPTRYGDWETGGRVSDF